MNAIAPVLLPINTQAILVFIAVFLFSFCVALFFHRRNLNGFNVYKCACYAFGIDLLLLTVIQFKLHIIYSYVFDYRLYPVSNVLILVAVLLGGILGGLSKLSDDESPKTVSFRG